MTIDFRALCAELATDLEAWVEGYLISDHPDECTAESFERINRARAALAAEPVPVPEGPAVDDIEALHHAVFASRLRRPPPNTSCEVDLVRAALARWGRS